MGQASYSQLQVKQDLWVHGVFVGKLQYPTGTFLDVGAGHATFLSNTFLLEGIGWRGLCVDRDANNAAAFATQRTSTFLLADAKQLDWTSTLATHGLSDVTYLSLDCDENTLDIARGLFPAVKFKAATIEHDAYQFGDTPRAAMRQMLQDQGYALVAGNVCGSGDRKLPFEDWWVDPQHVDPKLALEVARSLGVVFDDEPTPVVELHTV